MIRGPKPKPAAVKKLEGMRKSRIPNEPAIPDLATNAAPPEFLDEVAKAKWREVYPLLQASGVLKATDTDVLEAYCYAYAKFRQADDLLKKAPTLVFKTPNGSIQPVPFATMVRQWQEQLLRLGVELGLTPSARGRLNVEPVDKKREALLSFLRGDDYSPHKE